jgi:divalent metal cation (Fe/Co/Zn/Cd) transporter
MTETTPGRRTALLARAVRLEYLTIGWNVGEAALTIGLGIAAGSLALIGFGADSVVEIAASLVVVWHARGDTEHPPRTALALRLVAAAFAVLSVSLFFLAVRDLTSGRRPEESWFGIAYLAVTVVVMFGLARSKHRLADRLGSAPLRSEAAMTRLDGFLAAGTLVGLVLNAVLAWWWADPAAAVLVAVAAANEARENWEEGHGDHGY